MAWLLPFAAGLLIGAVIAPVLDWWRRGTRGEFQCDQCGIVTPLPKDDE